MVYKIEHFDRVARGFQRNGVPVAHDHALGDIPLEQHTTELERGDEASFVANVVQDENAAWKLLREPKL